MGYVEELSGEVPDGRRALPDGGGREVHRYLIGERSCPLKDRECHPQVVRV